jgi:hypothetical protein
MKKLEKRQKSTNIVEKKHYILSTKTMEKQMKTLIYVFGGLAIVLVLGAIYVTQFMHTDSRPVNERFSALQNNYGAIERQIKTETEEPEQKQAEVVAEKPSSEKSPEPLAKKEEVKSEANTVSEIIEPMKLLEESEITEEEWSHIKQVGAYSKIKNRDDVFYVRPDFTELLTKNKGDLVTIKIGQEEYSGVVVSLYRRYYVKGKNRVYNTPQPNVEYESATYRIKPYKGDTLNSISMIVSNSIEKGITFHIEVDYEKQRGGKALYAEGSYGIGIMSTRELYESLSNATLGEH